MCVCFCNTQKEEPQTKTIHVLFVFLTTVKVVSHLVYLFMACPTISYTAATQVSMYKYKTPELPVFYSAQYEFVNIK